MFRQFIFALSAGLVLIAGCQTQSNPKKAAAKVSAETIEPSKDMQAILDAHASLNPKPLSKLSAEEARKQPSMADAVKKYKQDMKMPTTPPGDVNTRNMTVKANGVEVPVRIYTPKDGADKKPVILYIHGGGWVLATIDTYDASARALAKGVDAVVVATEYRKAPEHKFPAAHNDNFGVFKWLQGSPAELKSADTTRIAVVGESAGGNMAAAICLMAQDSNVEQPIHQVLIYPVTSTDTNSPSYQQNANAKPLDKAGMEWFFDKTIANAKDRENVYLALLKADTQRLSKVADATIVTAAIDPLRSDGAMYADKLRQAGANVEYRNYDGVTHEFFGMADVVDQAASAQKFVIARLKEAFAKSHK